MGDRVVSAEQLQQIAKAIAQSRRFNQTLPMTTKVIYDNLLPMQKAAVEKLVERIL